MGSEYREFALLVSKLIVCVEWYKQTLKVQWRSIAHSFIHKIFHSKLPKVKKGYLDLGC